MGCVPLGTPFFLLDSRSVAHLLAHPVCESSREGGDTLSRVSDELGDRLVKRHRIPRACKRTARQSALPRREAFARSILLE